MKTNAIKSRRAAGMSLLEVLLAIVIFAVGMLALVHLQGNLARSSGDANARTVATNIAEEIIENALTFVQVASDPDGVLDTYADIEDKSYSFNYTGEDEEVVGLEFTVELSVQDYYFDDDRESILTEAPVGRVDAYSDFKYLVVDISWTTNQEFVVDENTAAEMGTGSIRLAQMIPSIPALAGALIVAEDDGATGGPPIEYTPGPSPDIMKIALNGDGTRFKESSTPLPDVIREGETVETWMDVVTYNQTGADTTFVRREEFLAVSCECTLRIPSGAGEGGMRPTVWTGTEYLDGEFVNDKVYGESASSQQSAYCDQCCRDHHDGGRANSEAVGDDKYARNSYDASRSKTYWNGGSLDGDHKHWAYDKQGDLVIAQNDGDKYIEACRMVRVNGWFRVAQDFPMQGLYAFPEGYLEFSAGATEYSSYLADSVEDWYLASKGDPLLESGDPLVPPPTFPALTEPTATDLPTALGAEQQQLQSRGLYIDYLSPEAAEIVDCMYAGADGETCGAPTAKSWLEVYPFFDAQVTFLSRWNESPLNTPVDITNDPVASDNQHDRGRAVLQPDQIGLVKGLPSIHRGNVGFTATEAIDMDYDSDLAGYELFILANNDPSTPPEGKIKIEGMISSGVGGVKAAQVAISSENAQCARSDVGYACIVDSGSGDGLLTVTGYYKAGKNLYACSDELSTASQTLGVDAATVFVLPTAGPPIADIVIQETPCP